MDTIFLAQIWGPILVAVGLGFFVSRKYYAKIYRDLEKAPFAVLFFGMFAMAAGIIQVLGHNTWETFPQILISALGWALLIKGIVCTVVPHLADRGGDWYLDKNVVPAVGTVALILGIYLSAVGYLM